MARNFDGKVAIVTGASMGLGRALALELARQGARVTVAARTEQKLREVAGEIERAGGEALAIVTDVAHRPDLAHLVEHTLERFGRLDVLVNNAGYGVTAFLEDVPPAELERLFRVNVFALVDAVQVALPALSTSKGTVVNVGSVIGRRAVPPVGAYCMTKAAVAAFSEALRAEVARRGVHVLQVEPGLTATHFSDNRRIFGPHPRTFRNGFVMSPETAASKISRAIARRRDRIVLGMPGRLLILANTLAPKILNRVIARGITRRYGAA